jgi:hypothetical protein
VLAPQYWFGDIIETGYSLDELDMKILDHIPFDMASEELFRQLHLDPQAQYAREINTLIESARQLARPRAVYEVAFVEHKDADSVIVRRAPPDARQAAPQPIGPERARFTSRVLRANLDGVERVFPYVVTCGPELDAIPVEDGDVFGQFCRDTIKGMALHAAIIHLTNHLKQAYALETLASMNPGSGDLNVWPIEQQKELFGFLGDVQATVGVVLTDTCLMVPNKSVSGIFFPSEYGFESCQLCHREDCPGRRAPFDPHLWEERLVSGSESD